MEDIEQSYLRQAESEQQMKLPSRYTRPDSIDNWRHTRMLDLTRPIWASRPDSQWITVGDGRYGSDAAYLHSHGVSVVATSLTDERLKYAHEQGHIPAFQAENAEHISLQDNAVDFVLCKEAYHHFPRPPVALYEMLRVARVAVVLIEPLDNPRLLDGVKRLLKRIIRGDREMQFEPSGNFLYRLNIRELGKLMTAMGGQTMAFKGINDFFHARLGSHDAHGFNAGAVLTRLGIALQNILSAMGLLGYGLGCVVVFKRGAGDDVLASLHSAGFQRVNLPRNPYVGQHD
ncbi:MAG: class I SAM-dependent methyltransferase [Gammaproteobacteria bacterium]